MDDKILNTRMTIFQPESCAMAIFGKSPCQSGQIAITFEILVQNRQKMYLWIGLVMCFPKI